MTFQPSMWCPGINRHHWAARGLIAAWPMFGGITSDALDLSGNGYTASGTNIDETNTIAAPFGLAKDLNGSNEFYDAGQPARFDDVIHLTVAVWVYPDVTTANLDIISQDDFIGNHRWRMSHGTASSQFAMSVYISTSRKLARSGTNFSAGAWHRVVGVFNKKTVKLYVDGVQTASAAAVGSMDKPTVDCNIGRNASGSFFYNGRIADVRVYDRAWSPKEVSEDYADSWALYRPPNDVEQTQVYRSSAPAFWHRMRAMA